MTSIASTLSSLINRLALTYQPNASALSVIRILFALHILLLPRDYLWVSKVPNLFFNPPPGPFALLDAPPAVGVVVALEILRALLAVSLLVGFRTLTVSIGLTVVLLVGAGLTHSFGKVDHSILYEIFPVFMGFAGWGARFSFDARGRRARAVSGYAVLLWAVTVGYALFSAAAPKILTGWLDPARQASRGWLAREFTASPRHGVLSEWLLGISSPVFWKSVDYATVFAEGWLLFVVVTPLLFRLGIVMLLGFHAGVLLTFGIDFMSYLFVYSVFFIAPLKSMLPTTNRMRFVLHRPASSELQRR